LIDYDELQRRLIVLLTGGRLATSFAIGHLIDHLRYLDVAVDDFETAHSEFQAVLGRHAHVMASLENLEEAVDATRGELDDELLRTGVRFYYRIESAYGEGRRVLDRVVAVVNELLPRTQTDLGNSHKGFAARLVQRCSELELEMPESLLAAIDDLDCRIKVVRDELEHPRSPLSTRFVDARGGELKAERHKVVRVGEDASPTRFEPAGALRDAIHAYVWSGSISSKLATGAEVRGNRFSVSAH
jgi:hypothetical protein